MFLFSDQTTPRVSSETEADVFVLQQNVTLHDESKHSDIIGRNKDFRFPSTQTITPMISSLEKL